MPSPDRRATIAPALGITVALLTGAVVVGGCDWFSTMSRTDAIQPHETAPLPPPEHAVPLDGLPEFDLTTAEGTITNPVPADDASRERGRAWYATYCAVCHGEDGLGRGPIADKFPAIPPVAAVVRLSDAYVFALIAQGRGLMPGYARIPPAARWDIVNYMRSMFPSPSATGTDVGTGTAAPPAEAAAGAAADTTAGTP